MRHSITMEVNGTSETREVDSQNSLLSFLRDDLGLTGVKEGCNEGECGACVVLLDGKPVNSCMMLAVEADGCEIKTIEGLGHKDKLHPIQRAFLKHSAVQCGFCTPGMILCSLGLLAENTDPTEEEVRIALAGNLCRCTGYKQIVEAVLDAAAEMREAS